MGKFKKAVKAVTGLVNDIVPNEIKPVVKIGLSLIPGVGPALSAAYTAADAYGGGASFGNALGQGIKSYAISQVAGAASRALGITTGGNDLTDALGQTKGEGILGLGSGTETGAQTLGGAAAPAAKAAISSTPSAASALTAGDKSFLANAGASSASSGAAAAASESSSIFTLDNVAKGAALAGGAAVAASAFLKPSVPSVNTAPSATAASLSNDAALAAEEETRRKRRGANSNISTSPLGLVAPGQSAASALLG